MRKVVNRLQVSLGRPAGPTATLDGERSLAAADTVHLQG